MPYRFLIVGAGIAGASAAYELAAYGSVLVLEQEKLAGYHTTGRSVAIYSETYGNATIRALNTGSGSFLRNPPQGFADHALLHGPAGGLLIGRPGTEARMDETAAAFQKLVPSVRRLTVEETLALVPPLRRDWVVGGIYEPGAMHMDVNAIHQGYLRGAKARGARLQLNEGVRELHWHSDHWQAETTAGTTIEGEIIVNAAGAWADHLGQLAGASSIGLQPKRRTAVIVPAPAEVDTSKWPFVVDFDETFYFKPESGKLLISPADETDMDPCDAYPDDYDIAVAIERIGEAIDLPMTRVERSWAGLRSFVADRSPVIGYDAKAPSFFWHAGQGGYGIQAGPAGARAVAELAVNGDLPTICWRWG